MDNSKNQPNQASEGVLRMQGEPNAPETLSHFGESKKFKINADKPDHHIAGRKGGPQPARDVPAPAGHPTKGFDLPDKARPKEAPGKYDDPSAPEPPRGQVQDPPHRADQAELAGLGREGVTDSPMDLPVGSESYNKMKDAQAPQKVPTPTQPDDEMNTGRDQTNNMNAHIEQAVPPDF